MSPFEQLIGLTGFKRCGKNTVASFLEKTHAFKQYAFADALRRIAAAVDPMISTQACSFEISDELDRAEGGRYVGPLRYKRIIEILGYERAKEIPDFRQFLQRLGTEGVRETFGPNAWVDALDRRVKNESPARVVLTDVRFKSEADWVHNNGGTLWWIVRPGFGGDDPHPSEAEIPHLPHDKIITANTVAELEQEVNRTYREL